MSDTDKPRGAGRSSFDLVDWPTIQKLLALDNNQTVLDLGCGAGNYSLMLAKDLSEGGKVIGLDIWPQGIKELNERAAREGLSNLEAKLADASKPLPLDDGSVDLLFMATVYHDFVHDGAHLDLNTEIGRVLAERGRLAVIEFKKQDTPAGPPKSVRLSAEDLDSHFSDLNFQLESLHELGEQTYMVVYSRQ
jgi:ubiquinone/menaquinone biosynthesis C-methylase UbiE